METTNQANTAGDDIAANYDKFTDMSEMVFRFKKDKLGNKRADVKGKGPVPSVEGFKRILAAGGKQLELLQDAAYDVVRSFIGEVVGNDENIKSLDELDMSKFSWEAIANVPKEDRRSNAIPAEIWKAFAEDYIKVMPAVAGKSVENVTNATIVYLKKFAPWKSDKKTIGKLKEQLAIYLEQPSAADFVEIIEVLVRRADQYLAADDLTQVAQNL